MAQEEKHQAHAADLRSLKKAPAGQTAWWDPEFAAGLGQAPPEASLELMFSLRPEVCLRRVPGRETFLWPGRSQWVVKRSVGGESKDYWYERLRGAARSPARRELENLLALGELGFPVPKGLAWFDESAAAGHPWRAGRSALVMQRVEHRGSLREVLASATRSEQDLLLERLLQLVTDLHAAGWIHRDLYLQHFVCAPLGLVLLDVGRARQRPAPRERWFVKDLAALHFSAPSALGRSSKLRFLRGWLAARGLRGAGCRRAWVKRITRRGQRMASHRPKHLDAADPVDAELFP